MCAECPEGNAITDLDDAFAVGAHIPDGDSFFGRWTEDAGRFRAEMAAAGRAELGIAYGPSARQAYDLFLPEGAPAGLSIFVHGGYWLRTDRSFWSHFAAGNIARGYACALPSYDLCPDVRIADITRQIAAMVQHAAARIAGPVTLSGHSAGGHLVARMLAPDMLPEDVAARIAYVAPISPVADLGPLLRTSMNAEFRMSGADAAAESPVLQPAPSQEVEVWVGADERPVFVEQARALADAWGCPCHIVAARHHFDVIDMLRDPHSRIVHRMTGAQDEHKDSK